MSESTAKKQKHGPQFYIMKTYKHSRRKRKYEKKQEPLFDWITLSIPLPTCSHCLTMGQSVLIQLPKAIWNLLAQLSQHCPASRTLWVEDETKASCVCCKPIDCKLENTLGSATLVPIQLRLSTEWTETGLQFVRRVLGAVLNQMMWPSPSPTNEKCNKLQELQSMWQQLQEFFNIQQTHSQSHLNL